MSSLLIPTANPTFPPKLFNGFSNFFSKKQQCISLLKLCLSFKQISQIHAQIQLFGLHNDSFLQTQIIRLCCLSSSKNLNYARSIIHQSANSVPDPWNMLIRGYATDSPRDSIWVFLQMRRRGVRPNSLTFPFLFKACAELSALREGRQVHVDVFKYGLDGDVYVQNNIVNFYGSCMKIVHACKLFDEMSKRSLVSWNVIMTACVENLQFDNAINYFIKMRVNGFKPDETSMVLVLSACSDLGNLSLGRWIHSQVMVLGLILNSKLGTALVEMYSKCGNVRYANKVFDRMPERNVWTWSAMILGLAQHGSAHESLKLFDSMMKTSSVSPNYVTFLGVLCACSHAGLVEDGYRYFHEMEYICGIKPMIMHYGAMVDILGRAGRLQEAYNLILHMPLKPDPVVWRTLLSACTVHDVDNHGLGDEVRKRLLELEPRRGGNLVMVANMYAEGGMWEKAAKVRRVMKNGRLKKVAGESCVELGCSSYKFFSGYDPKDEFSAVYSLLEISNLHMKTASSL